VGNCAELPLYGATGLEKMAQTGIVFALLCKANYAHEKVRAKFL
jgi:hypothetical protein